MRSRFPYGSAAIDVADFADEIQRALAELGETSGTELLAGECLPPVDVYERDNSIDIVLDVPGVEPSAIRVTIKRDTVLIVGKKAAKRPRGDASFHLVERDFGRFVRTVRVVRACDMQNVRAHLANGELHIFLPKIAERRGKIIHVLITSE
jgi:HSP20 family protein